MGYFLNTCKITDRSVRITLFRVLPGHEIEVGRYIENMKRDHPENARIFRIFGSYDLAFISDNSSLYTDEFAHLGTIGNIMGVDEYLCYKWDSNNETLPLFSIQQLDHPLLALCFVKINPLVIQKTGLEAELELIHFLRAKFPQMQAVGTLGWFENILLFPDESFSHLMNLVGEEIPTAAYSHQNPDIPLLVVDKTMTLLGHSLDVSDPKAKNKQVVPITYDGVKKNELAVNFSLSCKPSSLRQLGLDATKHFNLPQKGEIFGGLHYLFGPRDISINVPMEGIETLNQLIGLFDSFRLRHADSILKTYTDIYFQRNINVSNGSSTNTCKHPIMNITRAEATYLTSIGEEGKAIASAMYGYNNLLENNIGMDAFLDLYYFVFELRKLSLVNKEKSRIVSAAMRQELTERLILLEEAIDQRSQGVYTGFDETPFTPGYTGIAMIRVYKALEAYINLLVSRFKQPEGEPLIWKGFVLFGSSSRFEHKLSAIVLPQIKSLMTKYHWCLTHESVHVLQNMIPDLLSPSRMFQTAPDNEKSKYGVISNPYSYLLSEMTADILDYIFFCPREIGFDKYFDIVWTFLNEVVIDQGTQRYNYLFRAFAVLLYAHKEEHSNYNPELLKPDATREIIYAKKDVFQKQVWLNDMFIKHPNTGGNSFDDHVDEFHRAYVAGLPYVFAAVEKIKARFQSPAQPSKSVNELIHLLDDGRILDPEDLWLPELITWNVAQTHTGQDTAATEKRDIAFLLSLWNAYHLMDMGMPVPNK